MTQRWGALPAWPNHTDHPAAYIDIIDFGISMLNILSNAVTLPVNFGKDRNNSFTYLSFMHGGRCYNGHLDPTAFTRLETNAPIVMGLAGRDWIIRVLKHYNPNAIARTFANPNLYEQPPGHD